MKRRKENNFSANHSWEVADGLEVDKLQVNLPV